MDSPLPLISVIIPAYNEEKHLERCIAALRAQTYRRLELIFIDDGSTDHTPDILSRHAAEDERIVYIRKDNEGQSVARNMAVAQARGEYLTFADADDWMEPDMYERLYQALHRAEAEIACCAYTIVEEGKPDSTEETADEVLTPRKAYPLLVRDEMKHFLWNKLFRADLFRGIEQPRGRTFQDLAILYRVFARARRIVRIPQTLYYYRIHPASSTHKYNGVRKPFHFLLATHEEFLFGMEHGWLENIPHDRILRRSLHLINRLILQPDTPENRRMMQETLRIMHRYDKVPTSVGTRYKKWMILQARPFYRMYYRTYRMIKPKK